MKVYFSEDGRQLVAEREPGDPKYYGTQEAKGESALLHAIQQELMAQGHDVIKKRMHKDGHLVDDMKQYLRTRRYMDTDSGTPGEFCAHNGHWALRGLNDDWNETGRAVLAVER